MKIKMLQNKGFVKAGSVIELPDSDAELLIRDKYAEEVVPKAKSPKLSNPSKK